MCRRNSIIVFFLIGNGFANAYFQSAMSTIQSFLTNYNRPVTLLEISTDGRYMPQLAQTRHSVGVVYLSQSSNAHSVLQRLISLGLKNVTLMNPRTVGVHELDTLGRCEHFDVSIVDEECFGGPELEQSLPHLLNLGDYLFCIVNEASVSVVESAAQSRAMKCTVQDIPDSAKKICLCKSLKRGLDIARWNMHGIKRTDYKRYAIHSDFNAKTLRKGSTHTPWTPGINMITFIANRGIKPNDEHIMVMIGAMKKLKHNDLVLGNMIVQGDPIAVIDFNDSRRNVRRRKCIKAGLRFFRSGIRFSLEPEEALRVYKNIVRQ